MEKKRPFKGHNSSKYQLDDANYFWWLSRVYQKIIVAAGEGGEGVGFQYPSV